MLSARNMINVEIIDVKTGAVNSLVCAKAQNGAILKATVTVDSEKALDLRVGKKAVFLFKASSIIVGKGEDELRLSAANQIEGKVSAVKEGAVNSEIAIESGECVLSAIITNESVKNLALKVGDSVKAIIKATQIIVAVR